jgi:hypothetical protein
VYIPEKSASNCSAIGIFQNDIPYNYLRLKCDNGFGPKKEIFRIHCGSECVEKTEGNLE